MSKNNIANKGLCLLMSLMSMCLGCRDVSRPLPPTREARTFPIQRGDFHASVDELWDATLETIKMSDGIIVMKDRELGRIIYSIFHKPTRQRLELNVLLKDRAPQIGEEVTAVFLVVLAPTSGNYSTIVNDFFGKLNRNLTRQ